MIQPIPIALEPKSIIACGPQGPIMKWIILNLWYYWLIVRGIHWWLMVSSQKGPVMQSFDVFFAIDLNKLLSCHWFETAWHSCEDTVSDECDIKNLRSVWLILCTYKITCPTDWMVKLDYLRIVLVLYLCNATHYCESQNINVSYHWPFVKGTHLSPMDSSPKEPVIRKKFRCQDVIMSVLC